MEENLKVKVSKIGEVLNDPKEPLHNRFRALFTLRNIGGQEAIECISRCFSDPSALLKHELAYCLGQMQDKLALPYLADVLKDKTQEPMVRHEAGEAIGAIGCTSSIPLLEDFISDPIIEVAETCQLAIKRINSLEKERYCTVSPYASVDPTPAERSKNVEELREIFLNSSADLFDRYKAMFALRNINSEESILALCEGLFVGSALYRHEVAFVLGQIQSELSVESLVKVLQDGHQSEMVRHEAAEALGAIANEQCFDVLKEYLRDTSRVVAESCLVALDMAEYENSNNFQYADTATLV